MKFPNCLILSILKNAISLHFLEVAALFIIGFFYNYLITGALDPLIFSRYSLFVLNLNLVVSLIEGGIGSAIVRFRIRLLSEVNYLIYIQLAIFLIVIIIGVLFHIVTPFLTIFYLYGCIAVIFNIIAVNYYSTLLSYEKFNDIAFYRVLSYLTATIVVLIGIWLGYKDSIFLIFSFRSIFEILFFFYNKGFVLQLNRPENLKQILIESRLMASNGLLNSLANNLIFTYFSKIDNGFFLSTWNRIDAFVGVAFKQFAGIASKIFFPKFVNGVSNSQSSRMVVSYISAVFVLYNFSLLSKLNIIKIFGLSAFFKVTSTFELVLLFVVTDSLISLFNSLLKSQGNVIGVYALSFVRFLPFGFLLMQSYQNLELVLSISLLISFLYFIIFCKVRSRVIFILYFSVVLNLYFSYFYLVFLFLFFLLLILNYLNLSKVELIIKRWLKTEI